MLSPAARANPTYAGGGEGHDNFEPMVHGGSLTEPLIPQSLLAIKQDNQTRLQWQVIHAYV